MARAFDPYHKWLGIPPAEQPPNHYRLLGISLFESDADVIEAAADQRMTHLRSLQTGQHGPLSQKLLNETATAKLCLLQPDRRAQYDTMLRQQLAAQAGSSAGMPQPPPPFTPAPPVSTAARFEQADAEAALGQSTPGNPWDPDPHDFSNPQASYTRRPVVARSKSPLGLALLIAAPILGVAAVVGAIKVFNDREDADNDKSRNMAATTGAHNDNDQHPASPSDSRSGKSVGDVRPALLVLEWPQEERAGGVVILDGIKDDVSQRNAVLEYELKPGEHQLSLFRRGWETIVVTVPPTKDGERFRLKPEWKQAPAEAAPLATEPASPAVGKELNVTIAANSVDGYDLGPIHAKTTITLEYRRGRWKSWGRRATSNPDAEDTEGGDRCRLVISLPAVDGKAGAVVQMVPSGTANSPFLWRAEKDYDSLVLRINDATGKGPGKVEYRVTIR
jgi:hypothetical protein